MIPELIRTILDDGDVAPTSIEAALHSIMQGEADPVAVAGLLVALAARPVEAPILAAAARAMRAHRVAIHANVRPLVDTCGTGGDGARTFNISTAAAMVVAAAGAAVAKHGNRGVSSPVGSADVVEACGGSLDLSPEKARELLDATGFVFLFAPAFHPAMKHVAPVRRALGVRTLFNLLGPLANPALADCQLMGVFAPELTVLMAVALRELGSKAALCVHCGGLDEIGLHAVTHGHRLRGGDSRENAALLRKALAGEPGPHADVVALNAAAALEVAGLVSSLREGLATARRKMATGDALRVLDRYIESSRRLASSTKTKEK